MFDTLSKDIIQNIYEFDPTYREIFDYVLKSFVTPKMKVLQTFLFLHGDVNLSRWQVMKKKTIHYDDNFIEVVFQNLNKIMFYVMTKEEKDEFDNPTDPHNPMIIRSHLYQFNPFSIAQVCVHEDPQMNAYNKLKVRDDIAENIRSIQENNSSDIANDILYDILGNNYGCFKLYQRFRGIYDQEVHKYLFKNVTKYYDPSIDIYNYNQFDYNHREYTIYRMSIETV
jgi:hypothetical protein